jgi:hypothetical protein
VTASVDATAGEIGTLYQACNFHFVGVLARGGRILVRKGDGTTMSGRQARRRFGSESITALRALGVEAVPVPRRARYFAFRGSARECKRLRRAIAPLIKPYPKRGQTLVGSIDRNQLPWSRPRPRRRGRTSVMHASAPSPRPTLGPR